MGNNDDNSGHNPLADQLADLDIEVADGEERTQQQGDSSEPSSGSSTESSEQLSDDELFRRAMENMDPDEIPEPTDPGDTPGTPGGQVSSAPAEEDTGEVKTDRQLFEEAVDSIDPAEVYEAKFKGASGTGEPVEDNRQQSWDPTPTAGDETEDLDENEARRQVQNLRDEAMFHKAVGDVKPLDDRDKYHQKRRRRSAGRDEQPDDTRSLLTPPLPTEGDGLHYIPPLGKAQQAMMQRFERFKRSHQVPKLVVRKMTRDEAVDELRAFIDRYHGSETQFVDVVPGRGLKSKTEPVLKPAVIEWLEGPGQEMIRGYVPRRLRGGDYGSIIVELIIG